MRGVRYFDRLLITEKRAARLWRHQAVPPILPPLMLRIWVGAPMLHHPDSQQACPPPPTPHRGSIPGGSRGGSVCYSCVCISTATFCTHVHGREAESESERARKRESQPEGERACVCVEERGGGGTRPSTRARCVCGVCGLSRTGRYLLLCAWSNRTRVGGQTEGVLVVKQRACRVRGRQTEWVVKHSSWSIPVRSASPKGEHLGC